MRAVLYVAGRCGRHRRGLSIASGAKAPAKAPTIFRVFVSIRPGKVGLASAPASLLSGRLLFRYGEAGRETGSPAECRPHINSENDLAALFTQTDQGAAQADSPGGRVFQ